MSEWGWQQKWLFGGQIVDEQVSQRDVRWFIPGSPNEQDQQDYGQGCHEQRGGLNQARGNQGVAMPLLGDFTAFRLEDVSLGFQALALGFSLGLKLGFVLRLFVASLRI